MPKPLHEAARTLAEATKSETSGLLEVEFISPGWGSSGYYSPQVVEAAAPLFEVGTHLFFDHPTEEEDRSRPGRSVRDLAAVIEQAGTVDPTTGGVVGLVRPLKAYADLLTDEAFAKNVGLSIRGSASDITVGEAEGRTGPIIEGLSDITSVDFVTKAGRGGRVRAVLESARVSEATADDRARQLSDAVRAAHGAEGVYVWVRDQDAEEKTVWFEISKRDEDGSQTYQQSYVVADNDVDVSLTGEAIPVRRRTGYVPVDAPTVVAVTRPDSNTPTTTESLEDNMAKIQIEEADHTRLTEKAGRVDALESENATLKAENVGLKESAAVTARRARAMDLIREHEHAFSPLEAKGLVVDLPLTEAGEFDETKFGESLTEHAAKVAVAGGAGRVAGFGQVTDTTKTTESAAPVKSAWGRPLSEQKGA